MNKKKLLLNSLMVKDFVGSFPENVWVIRTALKCDRKTEYDIYNPDKGTYPGFNIRWAKPTPYLPRTLIHFRNPIWKTYNQQQNEMGKGYEEENWVDFPVFISAFQQAVDLMKTPQQANCPNCNTPIPPQWRYAPTGDAEIKDKIYFMSLVVAEVQNPDLVNRNLKYEQEIAEKKLEGSLDEKEWQEYMEYCSNWVTPNFYKDNARISIGYFKRGAKLHESKNQLDKQVPKGVIKPMELSKVEEVYTKPTRKANRKKAFISTPEEAQRINKPNLEPTTFDKDEIENLDPSKLEQIFTAMRENKDIQIAEFEGDWETKETFHDTSVKIY